MSEKLSNMIISNRISSGIKGLDDMIGGGFPEGHIVVVIGESGVGKTTFAMQFLMDGLVNKEPAIYISIEEEKESLIASARVYGWDMEKYIKDNKLAILNLDLSDIKTTSRKIKTELPEFIESFGAKRMVIDSITLFSIMFDDVIERRIRLAGLIKAIRKVGITSLFTAEVNTDSTQHSKDGIIEYTSDGVLFLAHNEIERNIKLMMRVVKMRRIQHDRSYRPYEITNKGIVVYPNEMVFHEHTI
jgi:KaiC domain protein